MKHRAADSSAAVSRMSSSFITLPVSRLHSRMLSVAAASSYRTIAGFTGATVYDLVADVGALGKHIRCIHRLSAEAKHIQHPKEYDTQATGPAPLVIASLWWSRVGRTVEADADA